MPDSSNILLNPDAFLPLIIYRLLYQATRFG